MFDPYFGKTGFARRLFVLRFRQLDRWPQSLFTERYGFSLGAYRDLAQGRSKPTMALRVLIAAIEADPEWMAQIAKEEMARPADWSPE